MKLKFQNFFTKKENLYLTLALSVGFIMAIFNPPFAGVPDEHAHYWKAWSIASGNLVCSADDAIPSSAVALPDQIKPIGFPGVKGQRIDMDIINKYLVEKDQAVFTVIGGTNCPAVPTGYLPQVIGLKLGQLFHLPALMDFYLARIFNLLTAILIVYWAIRVMPFGKMVFLLVGLLPMTIQQFSSLSYDSLHISLIFLFIAYVFKFAFEKKDYLSLREILLLTVISLVGLSVKMGYFPLSLLILLIPSSRFANKRSYWMVMFGIIIANVVLFLGLKGLLVDYNASFQKGVDPVSQMKHALQQPFSMLLIILKTFYNKFNFYYESFLFKSGWLKWSMPSWWYKYIVVGMVLFLWHEKKDFIISNKQRIIIFLTFFVNFCLVYFSLYLMWTKVGANKVSGVQGRYLLSIFPLFILSFYGLYKGKYDLSVKFIKKHYNILFSVFILIAYLFVFTSIYHEYYDKTPVKLDSKKNSQKNK